jgi:hypothetical protein
MSRNGDPSLRLSAYLCVLCVETISKRRERTGTQGAAETFNNVAYQNNARSMQIRDISRGLSGGAVLLLSVP